MNQLYTNIALFILNTFLSFASEQIELSSRTGKIISLESREYFGLFPEIKDYTSATLFKDNSTNYFLVNTAKSEVKIPVSDSSIIALKFVIDNFEEIVRDYRIYKFSPNLLTGLIKVNYRYNRNSEPIKLVMKDKSEISGYVLCMDSSHIVITTDTVFIPSTSKFRVLDYRHIYSIPKADYPIIDGSAVIWEENRRSIAEKSLLINTQEKRTIPPEAVRYIAENPRKENNTYEESKLDFDDLYQKRFSISADFSYQRFAADNLKIIALCGSLPYNWVESYFYLNDYYSIGFNLSYRIFKKIKYQIGYNYENINFIMARRANENQIIGNSLNMNLFFKIWQIKEFSFQNRNLDVELLIGTQFHWFKYATNYKRQNIYCDNAALNSDLKSFDLVSNMRSSYKIGVNFEYRSSKLTLLNVSLFCNYNNDFGLLSFGDAYYSRYIKYLLSFGGTFGFGIEF